jgi:hypothetical protein
MCVVCVSVASAVTCVNLCTRVMNERTVEVVCLIAEAAKQITMKFGIVDVHRRFLGEFHYRFYCSRINLTCIYIAIESSRSYKIL